MLFGGKKILCSISFKNNKYQYEVERHRTINDLYSLFLNDVPEINYPIMIRLSTNELPFSGKDFDRPLISLEKDKYDNLNFEVSKSFKCTSCNNSDNNDNKKSNECLISKYCLNCEEYICNMCLSKKDGKHDGHYLIDINPCDLKDSIKLWIITLQAELSNQITKMNKQLSFIGDKDFLTKVQLWKNNIIKKLNSFENIIKIVYAKSTPVRIKYKNIDKIFNKVMHNLNKSEQEINDELFNNEKTNKNYFSFDEAEEKIKQLKQNYMEVNTVKKEVKHVIDLTNINNVEKFMGSIPHCFDDLSKSSLAIIEDIKNFEEKNNDDDDVNDLFKYPYFLNLNLGLNRYPILKASNKNKSIVGAVGISNKKIVKNGLGENYFLISNKTNKSKGLSEGRDLHHRISINTGTNQESSKFTTTRNTKNSEEVLITRAPVVFKPLKLPNNYTEISTPKVSTDRNENYLMNSLNNNTSGNANITRVSFKDIQGSEGDNGLKKDKNGKNVTILKKSISESDDSKEVILPKINSKNNNNNDGEKNNKDNKEIKDIKENKDSKNSTINSNKNLQGTKGKLNKSSEKNNNKKK